ncbi:MAG: MipA/OmpV family protein [Alcanivoracaceae bacterium]|nr:MipA/OmpV family protein [Alcanivoracaceae bacterium]
MINRGTVQCVLRVLWFLPCFFLPGIVHSESGDAAEKAAASPSGPWSVLAGAGIYYAPDYSGSDEFDTLVFPSVDAYYKDLLFFSLTDGIGVNLVRGDTLTLSLSGQVIIGREAQGDVIFLSPIDDRLMPKLELRSERGPVTAIASALGDGNRYTWEAGVERVMPASETLAFLVGAGVKWRSKAWNDERYSVSVAEAALSGIAPFQAGSGLSEHYLQGAFVFYPSRRHVLEVIGELARLDGDAANSPLTDDLGRRLQPSFLIKFSWRL